MGSVGDAAHLPVIDISSRNPDAPRQVLEAASTFGFVFIENNDAGVPVDLINEMFRLSKQFFAASIEEKESVSIKSNAVGGNHGWLCQGVEKLDPNNQKKADVKEAFNMVQPINGVFQQKLPATLEPHAKTILAFQSACHHLCQRLNEAFAVSLGIQKDWFTSRHGGNEDSSCVFRMLYYPHTEDFEDGIDIRAGAHSDYGSVTLLFQQHGQPGLEIQTPSGEWASVPVDPLAESGQKSEALPILINIGDLFEDWTSGLLKSTVHRVIFPAGETARADRYSMAYFCHPLDECELEAVPSKMVEDYVAKNGGPKRAREKDGKLLTAADHLRERLNATYKINK